MDIRHSCLWRVASLSPILLASPASAAASEGGEGAGMWLILFLGLGALVILFQAIPAGVMLGSMLRALFAPAESGQRIRSETGRSNEA